ncbi:MAG: magnesium transporter [Sulfurimonas sp.]|jgi:magnesium transporter|uniref:magnesium transporter n=1 Tax=unclassified Sulfurimonas TaxID=2623549 RepID=UPI0008BCF16E|nr:MULTISPECIES: magnesium transporter [unclassified Sulfurimonas]MBS4069073.1 magnesium transporter [Sulfurimonas sp.]MDD3856008.1 magnesium transporter [Sulfurimonas sp.]MDX9756579.1 magnesium transporter [Sulfurimonas sp.]OHE03334.1 MAG: magnesium transporter [Sulfurimonas sp. RIFOXYB12_FULL_35_9]
MKLSSQELIQALQEDVKKYLDGLETNVHPFDIAELLLELREHDETLYLEELSKFPDELKALIMIELPRHCHEEIVEYFTPNELADLTNTLDTDDAAELIRNIEDVDEDIAEEVLQSLSHEDRQNLETLISYEEYEAGAYMQTELFSAFIDEQVGESIYRLKHLKAKKELDSVYQVYVITRENIFLGSIPLEDLILLGPNVNYDELVKEGINSVSVNALDDIHEVVEIASRYDMGVVPVIDLNGKLIGRITSDDIYDIIEERATGQLYHLAGVNDEAEQEESLFHIGKHRAYWLAINLVTAIAASVVIGLFDTTIQSLVALAVLMPIVASMGGNAGTQTLTVTVRQMALGDISSDDAKKTIKKEVYLSLMNGTIFAVAIGIIAWVWFSMPMLGVVIAASMVINLITAGFFGSLIPLLLQKADIDPAVGSSVLLTTVTDIVGFFSFLGLAKLILL